MTLTKKIIGNSCCSNFLVYLQCYFLAIAQILGTGVLALPVTLARSGLGPFVVIFSLTLLMQILMVYLIADLLQKYVALQLQDRAKHPPDESSAMLNSSNDTTPLAEFTDGPITSEEETDLSESDAPLPIRSSVDKCDYRSPDLHSIGEVFLPSQRGWSYVFDTVVLLNLVSLCVGYALAGSQAYATAVNISLLQMIPIFCWVLNFLVVFGRRLVMILVSILTVFKGTLLVITVVIAFIVGSFIHRDIKDDFRAIGRPFLVGTVALGGIPTLMPYLFCKINYNKHSIHAYRLALNLGLFTCFVLNILWCWAVLDVVPQVNTCPAVKSESNFSAVTPCSSSNNISLLNARRNGEISTIPFAQVINASYPQFNWVALLVTLFIIISITVSYTITGAIMVHTVEGILHSIWKSAWKCCDINSWFNTENVTGAVISFLLLSVAFAIAMANPKSFIIVLEKITSMLLNSINGIFMAIMFWRATGEKYRHLSVPVPLYKFQVNLQYLVPIFFCFAVIYDIVMWILEATHVTEY